MSPDSLNTWDPLAVAVSTPNSAIYVHLSLIGRRQHRHTASRHRYGREPPAELLGYDRDVSARNGEVSTRIVTTIRAMPIPTSGRMMHQRTSVSQANS